MKITLYGKNGCPRCFYCETKLGKMENIELEVVHDENAAIKIVEENNLPGEFPILITDDGIFQSSDAVDWVKNMVK